MMQVHIHMSKADTYETLGTFCLKENKVMCFKEVFGKEIVQSSIICKRRKPMLMMQNHTLKTLCIVRTLLTILNEYILYTLWDIESLKWRQFYLPNKSQKVNNTISYFKGGRRKGTYHFFDGAGVSISQRPRLPNWF